MISTTIQQICMECKLPFHAPKAEVKRGNAKFCSRSCNATHFNKNKALQNAKEYICRKCGDKFIAHSPQAAKFCSANCKSVYNRNKRKRKRAISSISCEICNWDEYSCDVHHIELVANGGSDDPDNLISLCPNHHRMVHRKLIPIEKLKEAVLLRTAS